MSATSCELGPKTGKQSMLVFVVVQEECASLIGLEAAQELEFVKILQENVYTVTTSQVKGMSKEYFC